MLLSLTLMGSPGRPRDPHFRWGTQVEAISRCWARGGGGEGCTPLLCLYPSLSLSSSIISPSLCHPLLLSPYGVFRPPPPTCQHLPIRSVLLFHPPRVCSCMCPCLCHPPSVCQSVSHRLYVCVCLCPTLCLCPCLCHPLSHCLSVSPCCVRR